jgi:hypothetical protein
LRCERLEDRTLPAGHALASATLLPFTPFQTAAASGFLAQPNEVDLYEVSLQAGDRLQAGVSAASAGSGLQSVLRIFDAAGRPVALDDQEGGDPSLSFQAATAGTYFVGVSSAGNDNYDPEVADSGQGGLSTGLYTLELRSNTDAPVQADVTASSFRLDNPTAAWGDTLTGTFRVENRGGAAASGFSVTLELAGTNLFDGPSRSWQTTTPTGLMPDQGYLAAFSVQLPTSAPAGLAGAEPLYLGLVITPGTNDPNTADKAGVHRGSDWEELPIVTPVQLNGTNHDQGSAAALPLNGRADASIAAKQADWYQVTVPPNQSGRLSAQVAPTSGSSLVPRLQLLGSNATLLAESDGGPGGAPPALQQHLVAGTYYLVVLARPGREATG